MTEHTKKTHRNGPDQKMDDFCKRKFKVLKEKGMKTGRWEDTPGLEILKVICRVSIITTETPKENQLHKSHGSTRKPERPEHS